MKSPVDTANRLTKFPFRQDSDLFKLQLNWAESKFDL